MDRNNLKHYLPFGLAALALFLLLYPWRTPGSADIDACTTRLKVQKEYLAHDALAMSETFRKYPVTTIQTTRLAPLNLQSNKYAATFRTKIGEALAHEGVNFAGHYTIVSVGMTGWGNNYYIVDRETGKASIFPYFAAYLDYTKDSNLIVMNSRDALHSTIAESPDLVCAFINQQRFTDLRPFYFLWQDDKLVLIGPKDLTPPENMFWSDYFNAQP